MASFALSPSHEVRYFCCIARRSCWQKRLRRIKRRCLRSAAGDSRNGLFRRHNQGWSSYPQTWHHDGVWIAAGSRTTKDQRSWHRAEGLGSRRRMGKRAPKPPPVIRAVLDTNVVISALLFTGPSAPLVAAWQSSRLRPVISAPIPDEYIRVLAYPKFELTSAEIRCLIEEELLPFTETVKLFHRPFPRCETQMMPSSSPVRRPQVYAGSSAETMTS